MSTQTIPSTAQAWRYPADQSTWDGYRSLTLRDILVPQPGKGEVLVKLRAVSLNYSKGTYPMQLTTGPDGEGLIPTNSGAGDVVAIGQGVTEWRIGDRVHSLVSEGWLEGPLKPEHLATILGGSIQGCLSQYRIFPAQFILPIPTHLSYEQAAAIPCAGPTAWAVLFGAQNITEDSTVLVLGSGGVSIFAAQIAKAVGARVIATTSSQEKARKYHAIGVHDVINYRQTPEWSVKVRELTNGQGVDHVIEIGGQGTLVQSIKSIKQQGYVHIIGFLAQSEAGQVSSLTEVAHSAVLSQANASPDLLLRGVLEGPKNSAAEFDSFVEKHKLEPIVDSKIFGWDEVVEAHEYFERGSHFGKVVIKVD